MLDEVDGSTITWVGDYPYLPKGEFLRIIEKNGVVEELLDLEDDEDYFEDDDEGYEYEAEKEEALAQVKSKRLNGR